MDVQPVGDDIRFLYRHTQLPYVAAISLTGAAWRTVPRGLATDLALAPGASATLGFAAHPRGAPGGEIADPDERSAFLDRWGSSFTQIRSPRNGAVGAAIADSIRDFSSFPVLEGPVDEWLTPQAGVPLYPAFFGRDAITAGWQAGSVDRGQSLDAALTTLGRMQSDRVDDWRDEEPGRIPYQVRRGPLALLNVNPYSAY